MKWTETQVLSTSKRSLQPALRRLYAGTGPQRLGQVVTAV